MPATVAGQRSPRVQMGLRQALDVPVSERKGRGSPWREIRLICIQGSLPTAQGPTESLRHDHLQTSTPRSLARMQLSAVRGPKKFFSYKVGLTPHPSRRKILLGKTVACMAHACIFRQRAYFIPLIPQSSNRSPIETAIGVLSRNYATPPLRTP